jgi:SAM-dependent methyltransferase
VAESSLEDLVARLERERREADRRYNDALTAVDRAIQSNPDVPSIRLAQDQPACPSFRRDAERARSSVWSRLARAVRRAAGLGPALQERLDAAVLAELERQAARHLDLRQELVTLRAWIATQAEDTARFESLLVQYLQTITAYVDTRDRALGGAELRDRLSMVEGRTMAIKRALDRRAARHEDHGDDPAPDAGNPARRSHEAAAAFAGDVESSAYVGFEDRFRGARDEIRRRVDDYVPLFASAAGVVVDIGCGRGELLELFRARGVGAHGVDSNDAMVAACQARGLDAERSDAVAFLEAQADASLGGLVAIQVVEHFPPRYLMRFLEAVYQKMKPGAPLVLETLNPACWMAFFECYLRDITHERALHPDTLRYLVEAAGFTAVDVRFRQPVREEDRLERVAVAPAAADAAGTAIAALASALNAHADKLNARLFSSMDYAVIARR